VRGGQCAAALGLFGESVPLYRAAIALGFPNLQGELAKAEQMRDDVRKAAELLEQENGARAKVCLRDAHAAAPHAVHVLHLLARAHLLCQDFESARSVGKQLVIAVQRLPGAVRSAPETPGNLVMAVLLARALCGLGKVDEARSELEQALSRTGAAAAGAEDAQTLLQLARSLEQSKQEANMLFNRGLVSKALDKYTEAHILKSILYNDFCIGKCTWKISFSECVRP
jgi:tetratricopeptide (TPR) repeat protein